LTKEDLKQIYSLNREIKMWQMELEKYRSKSLIKGQEITGMPFGSGLSDKTGRLAAEIADTEAVIQGLLARIQIERRKIVEYISGVDDSAMRQIIYLFCVSNLNWNQVAVSIGDGYTAEAVKQSYYRHVKKLPQK
jgi:hypothetical protein